MGPDGGAVAGRSAAHRSASRTASSGSAAIPSWTAAPIVAPRSGPHMSAQPIRVGVQQGPLVQAGQQVAGPPDPHHPRLGRPTAWHPPPGRWRRSPPRGRRAVPAPRRPRPAAATRPAPRPLALQLAREQLHAGVDRRDRPSQQAAHGRSSTDPAARAGRAACAEDRVTGAPAHAGRPPARQPCEGRRRRRTATPPPTATRPLGRGPLDQRRQAPRPGQVGAVAQDHVQHHHPVSSPAASRRRRSFRSPGSIIGWAAPRSAHRPRSPRTCAPRSGVGRPAPTRAAAGCWRRPRPTTLATTAIAS